MTTLNRITTWKRIWLRRSQCKNSSNEERSWEWKKIMQTKGRYLARCRRRLTSSDQWNTKESLRCLISFQGNWRCKTQRAMTRSWRRMKVVQVIKSLSKPFKTGESISESSKNGRTTCWATWMSVKKTITRLHISSENTCETSKATAQTTRTSSKLCLRGLRAVRRKREFHRTQKMKLQSDSPSSKS